MNTSVEQNDVLKLYKMEPHKTARIEIPAKPGKPAYAINPAVTFAVDVDKQMLRFIAEVPKG